MMAVNTGSRLQAVLEAGHFAVTAEIGPPKSASSKGIRKHTREMKDYCDAINLTDNQTAIVRLSSIAAAMHVRSEGGEPIVQMVTRDRNRIALQSDLLGAYSLGVRNVLCLTGDHQSFGNHPQARNVFDLDSIQLVALLRRMREEGRFLNGDEIKFAPPRFFIGAAANPFGDPFEFRVVRLAKKVRAGADFIQTQPVFDRERFGRWMDMVRQQGLHERTAIIAGVMPVKSARQLEYMKENVPGVSIPDELIARMKGASDQKAEGIDICVELVQQLRETEGLRGVHVMAVAYEAVVPEIVGKAGLHPRPEVEIPAETEGQAG